MREFSRPAPPGVAADGKGGRSGLPLSLAQHRLWFIERLGTAGPAYHVARAVRIRGPLLVSALERSLDALVARHDALRVNFVSAAGAPTQVIDETRRAELQLVDLSGASPELRDREVTRRIHEEATRPFDLSKDPLFRSTLLRLEDEEHVLSLVVHHIVCDAWSMGVLFRELSSLYDAFQEERTSPLPPLPLRYAELAREPLQGEALEIPLAYWHERLRDCPAVLDLPMDRPRPAVQTFVGAQQPIGIPRALTAALRAFGQREGVTLFVTLLAAYKILLLRHSGQTDLVVGAPIANRGRTELQGLVGFFVNTLVLRTEAAPDLTVRELLSRVREVARGAFGHQEIPLEKLLTELKLERDLNYNPLFQVAFALQNVPGGKLSWKGLSLSPVEVHLGTSKFDLFLSLEETPEGLAGYFEYNTDLWDAVTIARMAGHFQTLLGAMVAAPEERLSELPLLDSAERARVVLESNATAREYPREAGLAELFEGAARAWPERVAVVYGSESSTYAELNRRANRLARYLRRRGAGQETLVGVYLERSVDLVVSLLAILKAGSAYVPLDLTYPTERIGYMLSDAGARIAVTHSSLAGTLSGAGAGDLVVLDASRSEIAEEDPGDFESGATAANLAYVMYTSGSTGQPKGVCVPQRAVARLVMNTDYAQVTPDDVVAQASNMSFDAATFELWGALLNGAKLVGIEKEVALAPRAFAEELEKARVSVLFLTTALFNQMAREIPSTFARLRYLLFGGEAVDPYWVRQVLEKGPPVGLLHVYGPTESTTFATWFEVEEVSEEDVTVPIGRPIANTLAYVLDPWANPVPVGVVGELFLGGDGLARGYWRQPDLTAEKFVPDPFTQETGARLYRTGDRVRRLADGNIEFLGRVDHQVKVRGFRIELAEIEAALAGCAGVRDGVVAVRDEGGSRRLVGYAVAENGARLEAGALKEKLREKLPDYMVPGTWVILDALPLTSNGKVDRKALPAPTGERLVPGEYVAPRTPAEDVLSRIWREVLRLEKIGVHDNFFEAGGDSILSIQVVSRANAAGLSVTPKQMFQNQTIAELAAVASVTEGGRAEQGPVTGRVPLTPIQCWFFEEDIGDPHHFNQSVVLDLRTPLAPSVLERAARELVKHHDALRLRFVRTISGWAQSEAEVGDESVFSEIDLKAVPGDGQEAAFDQAASDLQASLDLTQGPLVRFALFEFRHGPPRLLIVIHHLAVDGVSWQILLNDLDTLSRGLRVGERPRLPDKTTSFQYWAERLEEYAGSTELEKERSYWLAARAEESALPVDFPGSHDANRWGTARSVGASLTEEETRQLLQDVPPVYRTQINDLLLTALAGAFAPWIDSKTLLLHLEGHGREELFDNVNLSRTVGWFTSLFPVSLEIPAGSPGEALKSVKEQLRRIPNRGIGYGILRYLASGRLRGLPEPQVSFNYRGRVDQVLGDSPLFGFGRQNHGPALSPRGRRSHLLDISGRIVGGRLRVDWHYSDAFYRAETIDALSTRFIGALRDLIRHCRAEDAGGATPSDFPLARLDAKAVDRIVGSNRGIGDVYPLTPLQRGILFRSVDSPGTGVFIPQSTWSLEGDLDAAAFEEAWQRVVDRHTVLRTGFVWAGVREPVQMVHESATVRLAREDWRGLAPGEQQDRLRELQKLESSRGFNLERPPLMRLTLIRTAERRALLVWTTHHLILDGWCLAVILGEVIRHYEDVTGGRKTTLPHPRPFRDYIAWLQKQNPAQAEGFWKKYLQGFTSPTNLGIDHPPALSEGDAPSHRQERSEIPADVTAELQRLARRQQLTLNVLSQGAWAIALSRYSGEEDVVFGFTAAGRPPSLGGVESMLGLFINGLPMRVDAAGSQELLPWLRRIQEQQAEVRQFEHSSLLDVQSWSDVPGGTSLFTTVFVFENYPVDGLGGLRARDVEMRYVESTSWIDSPLEIVVVPGERLSVRVKYDGRRFETGSIQRLLRHYEALLRAIATDPKRTLSALPMGGWDLPHEVSEATPVDAAPGYQEFTRSEVEQSIVARFEEQVSKHGDRDAVRADGEAWSYAELNRRANLVARSLLTHRGAGHEHVALLFEHGSAMVAAILGVLKTGKAYVPLDPSHPRDRSAFILADSRATVVLTSGGSRERARELSGGELLVLDLDEIDNSRDHGDVRVAISPDAIAYVLYTSGSTGQPKGVLQNHRNVLHFIRAYTNHLRLTADDRLTLLSSYGHDAAIVDIFSALLNGACLYPFDAGREGLAPLSDRMIQEKVTIYHSVPTTFRRFAEAAGPERRFPDLRFIVLGGEPAYNADFELYRNRFGGRARFVNLYGSTESTINSFCTLDREACLLRPIVSTGYPVEGGEMLLLDRYGDPAEVYGEIAIRSSHVALGYWQRAALTREVFGEDAEGRRIYRTGDMGRRLPDGTIECVGRKDFQLKVRGYRVEPGEVEAVLADHPAVKETAVLGCPDGQGEMRLVAYWVGRPDSNPSTGELRGFLKLKLPDSMVPSVFIRLPRMPQTPNGKLDRRALPAPDSITPGTAEDLAPPRTPIEKELARLWTEILGVEVSSVHGNFIELGGHSLRAMQVISRIRDRFQVDLPLRSVFEAPTVAGLALLVSRALSETKALDELKAP